MGRYAYYGISLNFRSLAEFFPRLRKNIDAAVYKYIVLGEARTLCG